MSQKKKFVFHHHNDKSGADIYVLDILLPPPKDYVAGKVKVVTFQKGLSIRIHVWPTGPAKVELVLECPETPDIVIASGTINDQWQLASVLAGAAKLESVNVLRPNIASSFDTHLPSWGKKNRKNRERS